MKTGRSTEAIDEDRGKRMAYLVKASLATNGDEEWPHYGEYLMREAGDRGLFSLLGEENRRTLLHVFQDPQKIQATRGWIRGLIMAQRDGESIERFMESVVMRDLLKWSRPPRKSPKPKRRIK
jgi:hypothetical protein